jgi:hypothetical protein
LQGSPKSKRAIFSVFCCYNIPYLSDIFAPQQMAQRETCNPHNMQIFLGRSLDAIVTQAFNLTGQTEGSFQLNYLKDLE